ncbi:MAG: hypothetical protein KF773_41100 [Deltaproteobacteria bacterium]|nr:hypothetical protein [Deltaproteobacteria bacterium]
MRRVAVVVLALAGCAEHGSSPDPSLQRGRCTLLENHTFESRTLQECGLTPDGAGRCFWQIQFRPSTSEQSEFLWKHSDAGEFGIIMCNGAQLTTPPLDNGISRGSFHGPTRTLTWEGVAYRDLGEDPGGGGGGGGGGDDGSGGGEVPIIDAPPVPF